MVGRAPEQRWCTQHVFWLFCAAPVHTTCGLWVPLSSCAFCAHDSAGSGGCSQPGEATLLNQNLIWILKGGSDIPKRMRDQGSWLSYPLTHVISLCELILILKMMTQKERKGEDGTSMVLSFQPLFIIEPRVEERVWDVQTSKSEIKPDKLVSHCPVRVSYMCIWKLPDRNCVFQWFCIPVKYSHICI